MVTKKEGAQMSCKSCGADLICHTKEYGGTYAATLQWQNSDGTAHYKTSDGKNFSCNIPEEDPNRQKFQNLPEHPVHHHLQTILM